MSRYQLESSNKQEIGVILFIFPLVASQFLSINLFTFLGIVISVEKLAALVLYPLALVLIGINNIRLSKELVIFSALYVLTFLAFRLVHWESIYHILTPLILMGIHLFVVVVLYSISKLKEDSIQLFFTIWVGFSVVTSVICILQAIHLLPVISTPISYHGAIRAEGLLEDPNYQAMVLLFGLSILLNNRLSASTIFASVLVFLGIISTFSRMGFLGLLLVIFATFLNTFFKFQRYGKNEGRRKLLSFVVFLIVLSLIFIGSLRWLPFFENAFISRFDYLVNSFIQVKEMISNGNDLSAQAPARYKLFLQSVYGFMDNLPFGIGYANVRTYMGETLGTGTYVHNTYMEYLLMGGVFGLAMVLYSTFLICRAILVSIKNLSHPFAENILAFTLVGMFVLLFLSINESIIPVIIIALNLIVFDNLREVCE